MTAPRRAAVLGKPIGHSLSPVLHRAAYSALGLAGWTYDRHECDVDELAGFVAGLGADWAGMSLTMPLKHAALAVAGRVTDRAAAVGAANTLVPDAGGWLADNTDVHGVVGALKDAGIDAPRRVAVLGAGGTAQAVIAALAELGSPETTVLVRDLGRATAVQDTARRVGVPVTVLDGVPDRPLPAADLVVSTLPGRAADAYAGTTWSPDTVLFDVLYDPWPTALAASARAAGCPVVTGLDMLLHQAVEQVLLMTGHPGPVEPMRRALRAEAVRRGLSADALRSAAPPR